MAKKILGAYIGHLSDVPDLQNLLDRFATKGEGRGNVVMVRLSDDALAKVDQLVEALEASVAHLRLISVHA